MSEEQKVKIVDTSGRHKTYEVFFVDHSFKSAMEHAEDYVERNKGKFPMDLYVLSRRPKPFPKWSKLKSIS